MILALSSDAAPTASLAQLIEGCARRGIYALHIAASNPHAITDEVKQLMQQHGVAIVSREADNGDILLAGGERVARYELNPAHGSVSEAFARHHGELPLHIILRGGGPEAARFEGRGIGALMARLTLSGYQGTLVLAPSDRSILPVWRTWLMRGKSWGCGSKTADPSLVHLGE